MLDSKLLRTELDETAAKLARRGSMPMCATILACTLLAFVVNRFGR